MTMTVDRIIQAAMLTSAGLAPSQVAARMGVRLPVVFEALEAHGAAMRRLRAEEDRRRADILERMGACEFGGKRSRARRFDHDEAVAAVRGGEPASSVAARYGVSRQIVHRVVRRASV